MWAKNIAATQTYQHIYGCTNRHISTEMEGKNPTKVSKGTPKMTRILLQSTYRTSNITAKIIQFSALAQKGNLHRMAEIEKVRHLAAQGFNIKWRHLISFILIYIHRSAV